jgi:hypothetical protein
MIFLLLGVGLWYLGRQSADLTSDPEIPVIGSITGGFVILPIWLYWLCGLPGAKGLPRQVVSTRSLMSQLAGIAFLIYGCFDYVKGSGENTHPLAILSPALIGISLGYITHKIRPFIASDNNNKPISS